MKLAVRIAAPLVAVLALSGCAHSPKLAATVGDRVITQAQVDDAVKSCRELGVQNVGASDVVRTLIVREVVLNAAATAGAPIDDAALDQVFDQDPAAAEYKDSKCKPVLQARLAVAMYNQHPASAARPDLLNQVPFELNPRYGTFDPAANFDDQSGSLSILSKESQQVLLEQR